ncbi:uncharacterized protein LOC100266627 [Vitis vinifera]|nr:uncharacterized protein LOC100266627 [Vitis vinifera]
MAHSGILPHAHTPLLDDTLDSAVDYKGRPARRCSSGRWRSACFIIGVEVAERFAYYGIESNLINYLTGRLGQSMATAAQNVNTWSGTASMLPLLGAFVADSYVGRYPTIVIASLLYILGLGLLTVSAVLPSFNPSHCQTDKEISSCSPPMLQVILFFFALYLVAVGQGGHKPCVQAFGADQFDGKNPEESKAKSSFFNWWYFCMSGGILINSSILNYIQDNLNWGLGFGIPCTTMVAALFVFLLGTKTYRYSVKGDEKNPFLKIGWVFVAAIKNWHTTDSSLTDEEVAHGTWPHQCSHKFKFLNKALLAPDGSKEDGKVCSVSDVEEAKSVLRLFPIWASCLAFAIVFAQPPTFFTKQGVTMDRSIGSGFKVPAASLQCFISLSILLFVPIYDRILVPTARVLTRKPSGITMLQRIGTGMLLSVIAMVFAALVEVQRLKTAEQYGLVDIPYATVPMAVWWLIPQYVIFGVAQVFTMVGLQEFFYDEVPNELRSVGLSLYLSIFGVGSFLSSFLISVINKTTGGDGQTSWFNDNLNQAHLDYFYWLLAGLTMPHSGILPHAHTPLLDDTLNSAVDYKGRPARRCSSGRWRSACFIIGVEVAERFAFYGIESNLINYLTGRLGQSMATAAQNVNTWFGTANMLPLLGAFAADSYVGRYPTIVIASLLYILGLGLLTVSAVLPSFNPSHCRADKEISSCSPPMLQVILFFFALYLAAVGQGGHKPCVQAFGADQFDGQNPEESKAKSSFFNWWYFCMNGGILISSSILSYIQDSLNWGLGFGIPCTAMVGALFVFLLSTKTYRYSVKGNEKSPFVRISQVFVAAIKNWHTTDSSLTDEEVACGTRPRQCSHKFKFLNKALLAPGSSKEDGKVCSVSDVEEAKSVLRLFPIWASCLVFAILIAQPPTFFTKQGVTMDRSFGSGFKVPAASLQCFISFSILLFVPIYDRILVPIARVLTRKPSGITMLQRIGTGMFLSIIAMVFAALVEVQRLKTAEQYGLVDMPNATIPMAVWWLIPQYVIFGVAQVFTMVGLQEFFYDEVPNELRSVGLSLYLSIFGVGSFLSSFLISVINKTTGGDGQTSWFNDNLNQAHLDYFYWLLAGLSTVGFSTYLYSARSYIYNSTSTA